MKTSNIVAKVLVVASFAVLASPAIAQTTPSTAGTVDWKTIQNQAMQIRNHLGQTVKVSGFSQLVANLKSIPPETLRNANGALLEFREGSCSTPGTWQNAKMDKSNRGQLRQMVADFAKPDTQYCYQVTTFSGNTSLGTFGPYQITTPANLSKITQGQDSRVSGAWPTMPPASAWGNTQPTGYQGQIQGNAPVLGESTIAQAWPTPPVIPVNVAIPTTPTVPQVDWQQMQGQINQMMAQIKNAFPGGTGSNTGTSGAGAAGSVDWRSILNSVKGIRNQVGQSVKVSGLSALVADLRSCINIKDADSALLEFREGSCSTPGTWQHAKIDRRAAGGFRDLAKQYIDAQFLKPNTLYCYQVTVLKGDTQLCKVGPTQYTTPDIDPSRISGSGRVTQDSNPWPSPWPTMPPANAWGNAQPTGYQGQIPTPPAP